MSSREIEASNHYSSKINEAYDTLKNYVKRINLILEKSGVSTTDESKTFKNSQILEDVMEIQEEFMFAEEDEKKLLRKE